MKVITAIFLLLSTTAVIAHDNGQYAQNNPKMHQWFESLKSGKGPCCSNADGALVQDADWESKDGHYRVRIEGKWYVVPDDAVITAPNLYGRTVVWGYKSNSYFSTTPQTDYVIRCFMPGGGT